MRSPDLTDDGLDERHQTSCVIDEVDPQDIHEATQNNVQDKRWGLWRRIRKYSGTHPSP